MTDQRTSSTALVTGAAGDIGSAVAKRLAAGGSNVVLADLATLNERLGDVVEMCREAAAGARVEVASVTFDVTDANAMVSALDSLPTALSVPDRLFNNAGYQGEFANLLDASAEDVVRVLDVNVKGVFNVLQVFARRLTEKGAPGSVVNTASMAGVGGAPNMAAYSTSKAAVIGLTKSAAKDLAPHGIRVNAISPAFIGPGAMWENQVRSQAAVASIYYADTEVEVAGEMIGQVPLRRYGTLDEVAASACFLLSDDASYLTGINIEIAGGAS